LILSYQMFYFIFEAIIFS